MPATAPVVFALNPQVRDTIAFIHAHPELPHEEHEPGEEEEELVIEFANPALATWTQEPEDPMDVHEHLELGSPDDAATLPVQVELAVSWSAVVQGLAAGVGVTLALAALPLLAVRRISPLLAIRSTVDHPKGSWRDPVSLGVVALGMAAITAFAIDQTADWEHGVGFVAGTAGVFAVLALLGAGLMHAARRTLPARAPYVLRQGLANLFRPNNRTMLVILSLGLGTFLIVTMQLTQGLLVAAADGDIHRGRSHLELSRIRGFLGNIGSGYTHRYADVRGFQRRCVIHTITDHRHGESFALKALHQGHRQQVDAERPQRGRHGPPQQRNRRPRLGPPHPHPLQPRRTSELQPGHGVEGREEAIGGGPETKKDDN